MEYPVWQLSTLAGGFWIAIIATTHVYVSHFAVGGGMFLVLTEALARRDNSPHLLDYVRKHTRFFLLLTMVFGGISGVGIWFTISVLAPGATSTLIHNFVWGWATEWVFFAGEIVALLIYYYSFDRLAPRAHMIVGWFYFLFAWLSLFIINGVIGTMLTPGQWIETGEFWDGFFNPSFWPSLVFRSLLSFMIAGLFGFLTATRIADEETRIRTVRVCAWWALISLPLVLASGAWYLKILPDDVYAFIVHKSREITPYFESMPFTAAATMAGCIILALRLPLGLQRALALCVLLSGFAFMGAFEFVREAGRKPWIIPGHTWAQGVRAADVTDVQASFLAQAKWAAHKDTSDTLAAGRDLFALQCLSCHSVGGPMNDIRKVTARVGTTGLEAYLTGQGRVFTHMPPFLGTDQERKALAQYITVVINSREPDTEHTAAITPHEEAPAAFDADSAEYVLLAWNTLGMKCVSDADRFFSLLPPGNSFGAVLIRRGEQPELVDGSEVTLSYAAPADFHNPASQVEWWKFGSSLQGKELTPNVSATGLGPMGTMSYNEKTRQFEAVGIPVVPYADSGQVNPYPVFTVTATDAQGQVLAETKVVAPVSTEMGCYNCHGGDWGRDGTGIAPVTAKNILAVHDARSKTNLEALANKGQPVMCQSCHPDPLLGAEGNPQLLNLPAAIHGFHSQYMRGQGEEACARCHPDSPTGVTRCLRDNHASAGLGCKNCHGLLEDHAVSLLKAEQAKGKAQAEYYMRGLRPQVAASQDEIAPRIPWVQEPDCMTCHEGGKPSVDSSAFNTWNDRPEQLYRNRKDEMEVVPCIACHGAPHATYPATNAYGSDRDNLQPMQYMRMAAPIGAQGNCAVCHTIEMDADAHH